MDAKMVADKYIQRGGAPVDYSRADFADDLMKVGNFIAWHEQPALWGGVRRDDAFEAFCRVINMEPHKLRGILRPD